MSEINDMIFHLLADIQNLSAIVDNTNVRENLDMAFFRLKDSFVKGGYLKKEEKQTPEAFGCLTCVYRMCSHLPVCRDCTDANCNYAAGEEIASEY